jgi:hypothetical protein
MQVTDVPSAGRRLIPADTVLVLGKARWLPSRSAGPRFGLIVGIRRDIESDSNLGGCRQMGASSTKIDFDRHNRRP